MSGWSWDARRASFQVSPLVRTGQLSALLLRPVHPLHGLVARILAGFGYKLPPLMVVVPALVAGREEPGPGWERLAGLLDLPGEVRG